MSAGPNEQQLFYNLEDGLKGSPKDQFPIWKTIHRVCWIFFLSWKRLHNWLKITFLFLKNEALIYEPEPS